MWLKWFPWRFIVRRVARAHGFLDPIALLARLHRFAQPSKVYEPIKLLHSMFVILKVKINDTMIENMMNWHHSGFSVYCRHAIWPHNEVWGRAALATAFMTFVTFRLARPIPGLGIALPPFLPPILAAIGGLALSHILTNVASLILGNIKGVIVNLLARDIALRTACH